MIVSQNLDALSIPTFAMSGTSGLRSAEVLTEAIAAEAAEAESLRIRTELMLYLQQYISQQQWSLEDAALNLRQPSPRMQNLLNGEIGRFSIEDLIGLLARVKIKVQISLSPSVPTF